MKRNEHDSKESTPNERSATNLTVALGTSRFGMAQQCEGEDRSKKRKKWINTLSILSSEEEEEDLETGPCKYRPCMLDSNQVIALRFPYPMLSDDSDDEDSFKYFPNVSPSERNKRKLGLSSDENNDRTEENHSYKHTKRKDAAGFKDHKSSSRTKQHLSSKTEENSRKKQKYFHNKHEIDISVSNKENKEFSKSIPKIKKYESKGVKKTPAKGDFKKPAKSEKIKSLDIPRKSPRKQKRTAFGLTSHENLFIEISDNEDESNKSIQSDDRKTSRFLDSSSENSGDEKHVVKDRNKCRRVYFLSTSSSSSDNEEDSKDLIKSQHHLNKLGNNYLEEQSNISQRSFNRADHSMSTSSGEENIRDTLCKSSDGVKKDNPPYHSAAKKALDNSVKTCKLLDHNLSNKNDEGSLKSGHVNSSKTMKMGNEISSSHKSQSKLSGINTSAWQNIAIADLKSLYKSSPHQSKVDELKRKLVSSNASSVAIYKKIQNREMTKNKEFKHGNKRQKQQDKHRDLQKSSESDQSKTIYREPETCVEKTDEIPSTSASQKQKEIFLDRVQTNQSKDNGSTIDVHVPCDSSTLEITSRSMENVDLNTANSISDNSPMQSNRDCTLLGEENVRKPVHGKKIRYAHDRGHKEHSGSDGLNKVRLKSNNKKVRILPKEKREKNSNQIVDETSNACDILGNIMSQMDNNPYKVHKPTNKKMDPTPDVLGWYPSSSNVPAFMGPPHIQNLPDPQVTKASDLQFNNNQYITNAVSSAVAKTTTVISKISDTRPKPYVSSSSIGNSIRMLSEVPNSKENSQNKDISQNKDVSLNENKLQEKSANTLPKKPEEVIIPFYSAPQEDYVTSLASSECAANIPTVASSGLQTPNISCEGAIETSLQNKKSNYIQMKESNGQPVNKEISIPKISRFKNVSKNKEASKDNLVKTSWNKTASGNVKNKLGGASNTLESVSEKTDTAKPESFKNLEDIGEFGRHHQPVLGNRRGNGAIRKEFEDNNDIKNPQHLPKGIRIRFGGTVFRLPLTTKDNSSTKELALGSKPSNNASEESQPEDTNTDLLSSFKDGVDRNEGTVKRVENKRKQCSAKSVFDSSRSKSPSQQHKDTDSLSSTEDSSSSESSETSSEESASDGTDSGVESPAAKGTSNLVEQSLPQDQQQLSDARISEVKKCPIIKHLDLERNKIVSSIKLKVPEKQRDLNKQGMSGKTSSNNDIANLIKLKVPEKQRDKRELNNQDMSGKVGQSSNNDIIVLSGSSDSDSNDQPNDKTETSEQDKIACTTTKLNGNNSHSIVQSNNLSKSQVGKIRVRSLKELGVTDKTSLSENALEHDARPIEIPERENNQQQNFELTVPASSSSCVSKCEEFQFEKPNLKESKRQKPVLNISIFPVLSIAVVEPVQLEKKPTPPNSHIVESSENLPNSNVDRLQIKSVASWPPQENSSEPVTYSQSAGQNQLANQNVFKVVPKASVSEDVEHLFFKLCDELFTDIVLSKILNLVDILHLLIASDIQKEERLKKIDQLISKETIISEKRRAEKDFADMIRIRGHTFVPLFMTIVNKIDKDHLKALITALYYRIVQRLQQIDPVNVNYQFKLRKIIKSMLQKHNSSVKEEVLSYFNEGDQTFFLNFAYIENLMKKYDQYVEERQQIGTSNNVSDLSVKDKTIERNAGRINSTEGSDEVSNSSKNTALIEASSKSSVSDSREINPNQPAVPANLPPPIGNLDKVFFKRCQKK